jgi:molybdopterin synthase catalytic subunit
MPAARLALTVNRLEVATVTTAVTEAASGSAGAIASFIGLVRGENLGRRVRFLEYEGYEPLALRAFERIEQEIHLHWAAATLGLHHRLGRLEIGEASVAIVVASPHRAEGFAACRYAIERVKQVVPIWKHEHFEGGASWIEGATADPDDESARAEALRRACG